MTCASGHSPRHCLVSAACSPSGASFGLPRARLAAPWNKLKFGKVPPQRDRAKGEGQLGMGPLKTWTPQEDERLRSLIVAGGRPAENAIELHRTLPAVCWR